MERKMKGRPKSPAPRSNAIQVRATDEQVARWKALAAAEGRSLSQWAARSLDRLDVRP